MGSTGNAMYPRYYVGGLYVIDNVTSFSSSAVATVANNAAETSLINSTGAFGTVTLPAGFLQVGSLIEIRGNGSIATDVTPPTINIKFKWGATVLSATGVVSTIAQVTPACLWEYSGLFRVVTIGASGTVNVSSVLWVNNLSCPSFGAVPATGVVIDTTAAAAIDVTATWGTASANNTITGTQWFLSVRQ